MRDDCWFCWDLNTVRFIFVTRMYCLVIKIWMLLVKCIWVILWYYFCVFWSEVFILWYMFEKLWDIFVNTVRRRKTCTSFANVKFEILKLVDKRIYFGVSILLNFINCGWCIRVFWMVILKCYIEWLKKCERKLSSFFFWWWFVSIYNALWVWIILLLLFLSCSDCFCDVFLFYCLKFVERWFILWFIY